VVCLVASLWVLVDLLNASPANVRRIRGLSRVAAVAMWLGFVVAD